MKPAAQTILPWLKANLGSRALAPLTSTDTKALLAAVQVADLWGHSRNGNTANAFAICALTMQEHTRHLAFHCVAHVLDWGHRQELWTHAGLGHYPTTKCENGPESRKRTLTPCPGCGNDQCPGCDGKFHDDSRPESHIYAENPPI